jgi:hypothetical protein
LGCGAGTIDSADDPFAPDAPPPVTPPVTPPPAPDAPPPPVVDPGIAPPGAIDGELALTDGDNAIQLAAGRTSVYRVDVEPDQHAAVSLWFTDADGVALTADRWDGATSVTLAETTSGVGKRFLSVLDGEGRRTYWFRAYSPVGLAATLRLVRTPFSTGAHCAADCARLIQMPLPNDPAVDGYATDGGTYFRYWFGRRDLVMFVRNAALKRAMAGKSPIYPYDFSQWDGMTPGTDVGAPRHVSHQRGKDVDISIYGTDGKAVWRSFCTTEATSDGRECVAGTAKGLDAYESAREFTGWFESGRVTMCFLDRELIAKVAPAAGQAARDGMIDPALVALYSDGKHLQHWPNHDNHIHVRVSETDYARVMEDVPFEAP